MNVTGVTFAKIIKVLKSFMGPIIMVREQLNIPGIHYLLFINTMAGK